MIDPNNIINKMLGTKPKKDCRSKNEKTTEIIKVLVLSPRPMSGQKTGDIIKMKIDSDMAYKGNRFYLFGGDYEVL